jgi:hypothetical protein
MVPPGEDAKRLMGHRPADRLLWRIEEHPDSQVNVSRSDGSRGTSVAEGAKHDLTAGRSLNQRGQGGLSQRCNHGRPSRRTSSGAGRRPQRLPALAKLSEADRDCRSDRHADDGGGHRRDSRCGPRVGPARARIPARVRDRLRVQSTYDPAYTGRDWRPRPRLNAPSPHRVLDDANAHHASSRCDFRA